MKYRVIYVLAAIYNTNNWWREVHPFVGYDWSKAIKDRYSDYLAIFMIIYRFKALG